MAITTNANANIDTNANAHVKSNSNSSVGNGNGNDSITCALPAIDRETLVGQQSPIDAHIKWQQEKEAKQKTPRQFADKATQFSGRMRDESNDDEQALKIIDLKLSPASNNYCTKSKIVEQQSKANFCTRSTSTTNKSSDTMIAATPTIERLNDKSNSALDALLDLARNGRQVAPQYHPRTSSSSSSSLSLSSSSSLHSIHTNRTVNSNSASTAVALVNNQVIGLPLIIGRNTTNKQQTSSTDGSCSSCCSQWSTRVSSSALVGRCQNCSTSLNGSPSSPAANTGQRSTTSVSVVRPVERPPDGPLVTFMGRARQNHVINTNQSNLKQNERFVASPREHPCNLDVSEFDATSRSQIPASKSFACLLADAADQLDDQQLSSRKFTSFDEVPLSRNPILSDQQRTAHDKWIVQRDHDTCQQLRRHHRIVCQAMQFRRKHLHIVYNVWRAKDLKSALNYAMSVYEDKLELSLSNSNSSNDHLIDSITKDSGDQQMESTRQTSANSCVIVDLLSVLNLRPQLWTLEMAQLLLPVLLNDLLHSKYEQYVNVATQTLLLIVKNFSSIIKSTLGDQSVIARHHNPQQLSSGQQQQQQCNNRTNTGIGVDITRDERAQRCLNCYNHLLRARPLVLKRQTIAGQLGTCYRELAIYMMSLFSDDKINSSDNQFMPINDNRDSHNVNNRASCYEPHAHRTSSGASQIEGRNSRGPAGHTAARLAQRKQRMAAS